VRIKPFIQRLDPEDQLSKDMGIDRYPLFSRPSKTEVGPAASEEWDVRYYDMFLFRHSVGIEVRR
jgi:hypothetical protein